MRPTRLPNGSRFAAGSSPPGPSPPASCTGGRPTSSSSEGSGDGPSPRSSTNRVGDRNLRTREVGRRLRSTGRQAAAVLRRAAPLSDAARAPIGGAGAPSSPCGASSRSSRTSSGSPARARRTGPAAPFPNWRCVLLGQSCVSALRSAAEVDRCSTRGRGTRVRRPEGSQEPLARRTRCGLPSYRASS